MSPWKRSRWGEFSNRRDRWSAQAINTPCGWECRVELVMHEEDDDSPRTRWSARNYETPEKAREALLFAMPQWALEDFPPIREPIPGGDDAGPGFLFMVREPKGGDQ